MLSRRSFIILSGSAAVVAASPVLAAAPDRFDILAGHCNEAIAMHRSLVAAHGADWKSHAASLFERIDGILLHLDAEFPEESTPEIAKAVLRGPSALDRMVAADLRAQDPRQVPIFIVRSLIKDHSLPMNGRATPTFKLFTKRHGKSILSVDAPRAA